MIPVRALDRLRGRERARLLDRRGSVLAPVLARVRKIVAEVRDGGDAALRRFTLRFDRVDRARAEVPTAEVKAGLRRTPAAVRRALRTAAARIRAFHALLKPRDLRWTSPHACPGSVLGRRVVPYERVGIYVPGGRAAYPSTVLMGAVPARLAGVDRLLLASPPGPNGLPPDAVLAAAAIAGVDTVFAMGGAQAIAAFAYGTRTVPAVEKIVGPGNAWVTAAKVLVSDRVGIDSPAGPSEILVLSDGSGSARAIAADLIAQAEHAPDACSVLVTTAESQALEVAAELQRQLHDQPRDRIIRAALRASGALLVARSLDDAIGFANEFAPEHLSILTRAPQRTLSRIRRAGSVFLGVHSPVALGDYCSGTNHILPTAGSARIHSGLSTGDFVRHLTWQSFSPRGLRRLDEVAVTLARAEGLEAHARSLEIRRTLRP